MYKRHIQHWYTFILRWRTKKKLSQFKSQLSHCCWHHTQQNWIIVYTYIRHLKDNVYQFEQTMRHWTYLIEIRFFPIFTENALKHQSVAFLEPNNGNLLYGQYCEFMTDGIKFNAIESTVFFSLFIYINAFYKSLFVKLVLCVCIYTYNYLCVMY